MKIVFSVLGVIALGIGFLGMFLPILPTTPFLLLAAWIFVHNSPELYGWLINHPKFGPYIRNFREYKALPLRVKIVSVSLVWITIGLCIFFILSGRLWLQLLLLLIAIGVSWHILSYKTLSK